MRPEPLPCPPDPNPYRVSGRRLLYDSPWIRLREDRFLREDGSEGLYPVCGFRRTACGVLALDDADRAVLVGQWRYPLETYTWEIVEGGGQEDESPFDTIRRELAEEAGLEAASWEPLLYLNTSNSSTDEETFLFLARELSPAPGGQHLDEDEVLELRREPFEACLRRVLSGEFADSLTVAALLAEQARRSGVRSPLEPGLQERFFQRPDTHPSPGRARWSCLEEA